MAKRSVCVCCGKPQSSGNLVCPDCILKMTPAERASLSAAAVQIDLLRDIRGQLDMLARSGEDDENQLGRIARAFEDFGRILKSPTGELDDLIGEGKKLLRMLQELAQRAKEREDDGEEWRG